MTSVTAASPAARAGLAVGDELLSIDGQEPRDVIDFQRLSDAGDLSVLVRRAGAPLPRVVRVDKGAGEPLGVEVSSAVFDRIRTCDNHCAFCFIYQLPKGMRRSLYLKDDDYRLSFLYGNFTTLTRFTELDAERILTERLGPLFVSIHTTDPELRAHMLRNPKGATSLRWLEVLLDGGIEVHGQIVVCPGVNDGAALEDTLAGILDRYAGLASVGAVPLGLSRYSKEAEMRPHTLGEAEQVLDTIEGWQRLYKKAVGHRMVFAADEYYLLADRDLPPARSYDGYPQHENGIGMTRAFAEAFTRPASGGPGGVRHGFFASVDAAPAEGYRAPRLPTVPAGSDGRPVTDPDRRLRSACPRTTSGLPSPRGHRAAGHRQRILRGQHRGGGPAHRRGHRAGAERRARRLPLPAARRMPQRGPLPRRIDPGGPAEGCRGGADGRRLAAAGARRHILPARVRRMSPMVVVAGRPNVGKSSLVNRIVGSRAAVVEEEKGVTRDRKELSAEWSGVPFSIMDTGGWLAAGDVLEAKVSDQAERALSEADVILMVVDVTTGVTDEDMAAAKVIRRAGPPVRLVVNKVDGASRDSAIWEFVSLGLGDPYPVSSLHGRGTGDLLDEVVALLPVPLPDDEEAAAARAGNDDRGARGDRAARNAERRHHRPAQCGQVDAVQQASG